MAIGKKERQALLDLLWERAVMAAHGNENEGLPVDADEAWTEFKQSLAKSGFELDLTIIGESQDDHAR